MMHMGLLDTIFFSIGIFTIVMGLARAVEALGRWHGRRRFRARQAAPNPVEAYKAEVLRRAAERREPRSGAEWVQRRRESSLHPVKIVDAEFIDP
jgi:hypothetical protein